MYAEIEMNLCVVLLFLETLRTDYDSSRFTILVKSAVIEYIFIKVVF